MSARIIYKSSRIDTRVNIAEGNFSSRRSSSRNDRGLVSKKSDLKSEIKFRGRGATNFLPLSTAAADAGRALDVFVYLCSYAKMRKKIWTFIIGAEPETRGGYTLPPPSFFPIPPRYGFCWVRGGWRVREGRGELLKSAELGQDLPPRRGSRKWRSN